MSETHSGEYIKLEKLGDYALDVSKSIRMSGYEKGLRSAEEVLHELSKIKKDITRISKRENTENDTPKAAEWLLDNWYIAEREGKEAALELRKIKRIRKSGSESIIGQLASSLVRAGNGSVDDKRIGKFLDACQENIVLNEYELAAFVPMLKAKLIGLLGEASGDITADGAEELFENIFTSLRFLSGFDMGKTLENVNRVERELYLDPAGVYPRMDETTRREYRNEIAKLARKKRCTEYKAAAYIRKAAELDGRHIGYYIFKKPFGHEKKEKDGSIYIASIVLASLFFTILAGFMLETPIACVLLLFPISEIVKNIVDFTIIKTVRPKHIPRMGMKKGVPAEGRTVCVISALLNSKESAPIYAAQLEEYYLANRSAGGNLIFGVLGDLSESRTEQNEGDNEIIEKMRAEIDGLNEKYGGRFYFFCRPRKYNESCARYMGWERKRGAILELVRLIKGRDSGIDVICGEKRSLYSVKYIITLDSDTTLEPDTAMELIGAMLHPLNRAVVDKRRKIVKEGSGIIQPRVSVSLEAANKSDFTRIFAGRGGTDPYGGTVSDVYQDIFGRGSFNGKGIIDVDAYYECLDDRFPENAILSHDLLEGAYLHCSYMGECELTDGYPYKVTSYYDRMHRWVRGDWQTIPWLGRKVKNANGEMIENPMSEIDKWKIADNLRRSLTPVFTFAAIVTGMFTSGQDFAWACFIAILSAVSALLISSADLALRHDDELKLRYQSTVVSGFAGCFLQTVIRLIFLPYEAWTAFSAIVTALYRMKVSHKNMLSWVTAAETEKKTKGKWRTAYAKMWQCIAISAVIWIFSPYPAAYAVGIIWFFAPPYAAIISGEIKQQIKLTPSERNYVLNAAADIWRYFTDFVTPSENYLPPDNWQEQPAAGVAHRTSPTNIGLAMMSALAAFDMGIANRQTALGMIENMLATVKRLPKWNGHLYNWYDTRTLNILRPNYVSTVDSGNFAASLIVVREAMYELGADKLAEDITRILDGMDFGVLYDKTRRLFYIGWDDEKNAPTEGWYDLMESEARQTSYVAIARGDVPRKHWRQLSRVLVAQDDYSGMASWTGTMFEYLMPNLILPCYKNSMIYESSKFCVYAQKRAARDIPWGMSESAFYAFDQSLSYRYKAHGAQKLALKRGMDADRVISPYSSFLAMTVEPKQAIKNLRRMDEMGLCSRYGFYEAADFTPDRTEGKRFRPVKTFMAHHLGMSIIAADNVVNDNIMQARFMRNREMSAYKSLLQEKVVASGIMIKRVVDIPEKPGRNEIAGWSYVSDKPNAFDPMCCLLSNGSYTVMVTESGLTRSKWRDTDMLSFDTSQISPHSGMLYTFRTEKDEFPLTFAPYFDRESSYSAEFSGAIARLTSRRGALTSSLEIKVPRDDMGEKREVELLLGAGGDIRGKLVCDFEAVLAKLRDFYAHPAYSRLSLEIKAYENALVIKRRSSSDEIEKYMCIAVSAPSEFYCGGERGRVRPLMPGKKY